MHAYYNKLCPWKNKNFIYIRIRVTHIFIKQNEKSPKKNRLTKNETGFDGAKQLHAVFLLFSHLFVTLPQNNST